MKHGAQGPPHEYRVVSYLPWDTPLKVARGAAAIQLIVVD
jgi:hypothetical protein